VAPFVGDWAHPAKWLLAIPMFVSFVVFTIAVLAETNRLPFDLPEAEQELAGGYHTEYASMKFGLFFLGEYIAMITGSGIITTLFLGGWHFPGIPDGSHGWIFGLINIAVFFAKVAALIFLFMWVRWTLPRFRWDQFIRHSSFVVRASDHGDHRSTTESELARANVFAHDRGRLVDHDQAFQKHDFSPDESDDGIPGGEVGLQLARALPRRARARARHR